MNRDFQKFKRGQVWWVDRGEVVGSVENKRRPMLMISNDDGNAKAGTFIVIPTTSQPKPKLPVNVEYMSDTGRKTVLCNQITTVDVSQIQNYEGTLCEDTMRKVEDAVCVAIAIKRNRMLLRDIQDAIESIFNEYIAFIDKEKCYITAEDVVNDLKTKLVELREEMLNPDTHGISVDDAADYAEPLDELGDNEQQEEEQQEEEQHVEHKSEQKAEQNGIETSTNKHTRTRAAQGYKNKGYWTEDNMLTFLADAESLSDSDMLEKWHIKGKTTLWTYKSKFKKKLDISDDSNKNR